jgi:mannose-1-phosphate guanylyltransferase
VRLLTARARLEGFKERNMVAGSHVWVVVLAGGDGVRLAPFTMDRNGRSIPKQYCSLNGGDALISEALRRAYTLVPIDRACVVVAQKHCEFWLEALIDMPWSNVIVQPENRGTANEILLATLTIRNRDPQATILFMPSDHFVLDEELFVADLKEAADCGALSFGELTLIGMEPETADPDLGYIVADSAISDRTRRVVQFIEKPGAQRARVLCSQGALWNTLIFIARVDVLVRLLELSFPGIVESMLKAMVLAGIGRPRSSSLTALYEDLPTIDFSKAVLQGNEGTLRVTRSRTCGWTDLGDARRVALALQSVRPRSDNARVPFDLRDAHLGNDNHRTSDGSLRLGVT